MNPVIESIYATGKVADPEGNLVETFPVSVPYNTGSILYDLVRRERLSSTLETGFAYGVSTMFLCQAHADNAGGTHVAIDPKQTTKWRSIGLLNVERAGLGEHLRFLEAPSHEALPRLLGEGQRFQLAFIDGVHLFDYALVDFFYADMLLDVGGYVVLDDLWMKAMRRVISYILTNRSYRLVRPEGGRPLPAWVRAGRIGRRLLGDPLGARSLLRVPENIAILRKEADDSRRWDFHRPF